VPLTRLLHRDAFAWNKEAEDAFQVLKHALTTRHILQVPEFDKLFIVDCDASDVGLVLCSTRAPDPSRSSAALSPLDI
jgi:hypothetical protein